MCNLDEWPLSPSANVNSGSRIQPIDYLVYHADTGRSRISVTGQVLQFGSGGSVAAHRQVHRCLATARTWLRSHSWAGSKVKRGCQVIS